MTLIWGANYSIVKSAFSEIDPQAFNAVRMFSATLLFVAVMIAARRNDRLGSYAGVFYTPAPFTRRDWLTLAWLGLVGHFLYQVLFIGGLARTSVANSSLIIAASPAVIAFGSALVRHERIGPLKWAGVGLGLLGVVVLFNPIGIDWNSGDWSMYGKMKTAHGHWFSAEVPNPL